MNVYAVIYGDDWQAGHWIFGVYTSKALAESALAEIKAKFPYPDECFIEAMQLDSTWDDYNV